MISQHWTTSSQHWNNVVYVHVEISNVELRRINVVCFSIDINNVRQRRNNIVIFNVEFHNIDQRPKNVLYMTIFKKLKRAKKDFWASKTRWLIWLRTLALDCDRLKRKGNMERTIEKQALETIMYVTWKEYENNNMSLLMEKQIDVRDSTNHPHLHVIALLKFHIVKKQHMYFPLYSSFPFFRIFYGRYYFLP